VGKVQIYETVDNGGFRVAQPSMDGILSPGPGGPLIVILVKCLNEWEGVSTFTPHRRSCRSENSPNVFELGRITRSVF